MKPNVSVIIATYRQTPSLQLQLAALSQQLAEVKFEVIVCDDGSPSCDSIDAVRLVAEQSNNTHYIRPHKDGSCVPRMRNYGITVSQGDVLIFLDGDMVPSLDLVQTHWNIHQHGTKKLVAGHRIRKPLSALPPLPTHEIVQQLDSVVFTDDTIIRRQTIEEQRRVEYIQSPHPWRAMFGCHLSVRKSPVIQFDERFKGWGPEDWAFSHRLFADYGYAMEYHPEAIAYEIESGYGSGNIFRYGGHKEISLFLRNLFLLSEQCPNLKEEIFWSLPRFCLQPDGTWKTQPIPKTYNLDALISATRAWIETNMPLHSDPEA